MKKKTVLVHPCPKCGSSFLAHGKPYGCTTPRILAWLASAAVAVACILKTGNADFLQILAFPFFVCILT